MDRLRSLRNYVSKRTHGFAEWWTGTDVSSSKKPKCSDFEALQMEFRSLRLEYDEQLFNEWAAMKKITGNQLSILRRQVPRDMKNCDKFLGNQHVVLAELIDKEERSASGIVMNSGVGFHNNKDCRRIVGIVQPFGAGKTKTALMLSHAFVVLPIRWTDHLLKAKLEETEEKLFGAMNCETVSMADVVPFSLRCRRLMELALLSVAAVFNVCDSQSWFDATNEQHRLQFSLLAIETNNALISEMAKWFEEHTEETTDQLRFDRLRKQVLDEVRERSFRKSEKKELRLVYVMDEVQKLFGLCTGYCLHTDWNMKAGSLENWKYETSWKKEAPGSGYSRCTDLYHQLGMVMNAQLGVDAAFVMCSTMFSTWTTIENMRSPESKLQEFTATHWLSADDCKKLVQHYYKVSDELLSSAKLDFGLFTRPRFACNFITQLYADLSKLETSADEHMKTWLRNSFEVAKRSSMKSIEVRVELLIDKPVNLNNGNTNSRIVLNKVVTSIRLSAGVLHAKENVTRASSIDRWRSYAELAGYGLMKFRGVGSTNQVELADLLTVDAILVCYSRRIPGTNTTYERSAVLRTIATHLHDSESFQSQNKTPKGFGFETLLAYFAISGLIRVPKYAATGSVTYENLRSTAEFVAGYDELEDRLKESEGEAAYICGLFGDQWSQGVRNAYVYLPQMMCGPDVVFRGKKVSMPVTDDDDDDNNDDDDDDDNVNVAIQSKAWKKTLSFALFLQALSTVTPATMFINRDPNELATWKKRRNTFETEFMRIVFSELGFTDDVQYVVHQYNLRQAKMPKPSFIHLLNFNDLKDSLGAELHAEMRAPNVQPNLIVDGVVRPYEMDENLLSARLKKLTLS